VVLNGEKGPVTRPKAVLLEFFEFCSVVLSRVFMTGLCSIVDKAGVEKKAFVAKHMKLNKVVTGDLFSWWATKAQQPCSADRVDFKTKSLQKSEAPRAGFWQHQISDRVFNLREGCRHMGDPMCLACRQWNP